MTTLRNPLTPSPAFILGYAPHVMEMYVGNCISNRTVASVRKSYEEIRYSRLVVRGGTEFSMLDPALAELAVADKVSPSILVALYRAFEKIVQLREDIELLSGNLELLLGIKDELFRQLHSLSRSVLRPDLLLEDWRTLGDSIDLEAIAKAAHDLISRYGTVAIGSFASSVDEVIIRKTNGGREYIDLLSEVTRDFAIRTGQDVGPLGVVYDQMRTTIFQAMTGISADTEAILQVRERSQVFLLCGREIEWREIPDRLLRMYRLLIDRAPAPVPREDFYEFLTTNEDTRDFSLDQDMSRLRKIIKDKCIKPLKKAKRKIPPCVTEKATIRSIKKSARNGNRGAYQLTLKKSEIFINSQEPPLSGG